MSLVRAEELAVNDKFKHVNRRDDTTYVVHKVSEHHVLFHAEGGHVELGITKDTVVQKV